MALLQVHSQNYSQIRKKSFNHACNQVAVSQRPVSYRGQLLTPTMLRRMGNCPPPARTKVASATRARAGRATQASRVLSWNAGHLGQQQWSEIMSWLSTEASQTCDILVLQETHWQTTAEFTASGWYCVSSASPDDTIKAKKKGRGGTAQTNKEAATRPESNSQDQQQSGPSVVRGHGSPVPTHTGQKPSMEGTRRRPGLGGKIRLAGRSGHCSCSLSACLVTGQNSAQSRFFAEGTRPLHQAGPPPGHLDPGR